MYKKIVEHAYPAPTSQHKTMPMRMSGLGLTFSRDRIGIKTSNQINVPVLVCFGGQARVLIQKLDPDVLLSSSYDTPAHIRTPLWCCSCSFSSSSRSRSNSSSSRGSGSSSNNSSMRSRRSRSSRSMSERRKMVGPNRERF